jgi:hypothetical protein
MNGTMRGAPAHRASKVILGSSVLVLAVSGLGQMPIFKRYYLADLPGLGWLADYSLLHLLHYAAAAVFLVIVLHRAVESAALVRLGSMRPRLLDWLIAATIGSIVLTGMMRVLKNFAWFSLTPGEALFADLAHLAAVIVLGAAVLVRTFSHRGPSSTGPDPRTGPVRSRQ